MSTDRHTTSGRPPARLTRATADWYRVAGHPAGIRVLTDTPVRRIDTRPSAPVSRPSPRSKHA